MCPSWKTHPTPRVSPRLRLLASVSYAQARVQGGVMRRFLVLTICVIALAAVMVMSTGSTEAQGQTCLTVTSQGSVQGLDHGASCAFLGIPFAAPPIAGLRWKAPQPASSWAPNLLVATMAVSCAQLNAVTGVTMGS